MASGVRIERTTLSFGGSVAVILGTCPDIKWQDNEESDPLAYATVLETVYNPACELSYKLCRKITDFRMAFPNVGCASVRSVELGLY